jgi:hypothetical protein
MEDALSVTNGLNWWEGLGWGKSVRVFRHQWRCSRLLFGLVGVVAPLLELDFALFEMDAACPGRRVTYLPLTSFPLGVRQRRRYLYLSKADIYQWPCEQQHWSFYCVSIHRQLRQQLSLIYSLFCRTVYSLQNGSSQ